MITCECGAPIGWVALYNLAIGVGYQLVVQYDCINRGFAHQCHTIGGLTYAPFHQAWERGKPLPVTLKGIEAFAVGIR